MLTRKFIAPILAAGLLVMANGTSRAEEALVTFKILSLETALEMAQVALGECRKRGFQTAVSVVDRFGNLQVTLKDRFAGPHTPETARRKAWTAVSFRTSTLEMEKLTQAGKPQSGVRFVTEALMIGGGLPIQAAGSLVGAIGVSGAPGGELDEACAQAGYKAIEDKLAF